MTNYILTNKAVEDLTNIWDYTCDNWSLNQAEIYYKLLVDSFVEISNNPNYGKNYTEISTEIKGFNVGKHIIFYLIQESSILIIRILHEQMDLKNRINEK